LPGLNFRLTSKKFLSNMIVLVLSFILMLALSELVVRFIFPQEDILLRTDEEIGWVPRENLNAIWEREVEYKSGYSTFLTNEHGLRLRATSMNPDYTIYMFGDSFIQAANVNEEDTATKILQQNLRENLDCRIDVLNLGVQRYGPIHAYHWYLRNSSFLPKPDLVVYSCFLGNDFVDSYVHSSPQSHLSADVEDGQITEVAPLISKSFTRQVLMELSYNSDLVRLLRRRIYKFSRRLDTKLLFFLLDEPGIKIGRREEVKEKDASAMLQIALHYLVQIRDQSIKDGADFLIAFIPEGTGLTDSQGLLYDQLTRSLEERDMAVVHFTSAQGFEDSSKAWYVKGKGHFTLIGNRKYAKFLTSEIIRLYETQMSGKCNN